MIQYNKRDLDGIAGVAELSGLLNPTGAPEFEAAASHGRGVFDTLRAIAKLALKEMERGHRWNGKPEV